jgi:mono/diheme cytochrome c family protein
MSSGLRALLVGAAIAIAAFTANAPLRAQQDASLPPGAGQELVATACTQCHAASVFTHLRWGKEAWRHQVYDMVERGAQVSPAELDTVVTYLTTNFGPGVPFPGQTPAHPALPPGAGADIVATRCTICHSAERVTSANRSRAQWTTVVARMVFFGAPLPGDQTQAVIAYLSTNYGTGH